MPDLFGIYGELCATHPWEVIVAIITLTTSFLTLDRQNLIVNHHHKDEEKSCVGCYEEQFNAADLIVMTIIRCLAILYTYHQFRNLQRLGSKYVLGIAGLFVVFSSFVFTSTVLNLLHIDLVDLKDALFFFLLLIDLSKAATLAQFALTASDVKDISRQISRGVSVLGPTMTLDTVVETLVIGVGTLSGVQRLETLSYFACLSAIVNYLIFMTFYPACLSLTLELARIQNFYGENQKMIELKLLEENEKSNPALQRVKLIMSFGLMAVHIHSRWTLKYPIIDNISEVSNNNCEVDDNTNTIFGYLMKQFASSADHIVILILLITLMVKFIFFEPKNDDIRNTANTTITKVPNSNVEVQTDDSYVDSSCSTNVICHRYTRNDHDGLDKSKLLNVKLRRSLKECLDIYRNDIDGALKLSDDEIIMLVDTKHIPAYNLEKAVADAERGVKIRRQIVRSMISGNCDFMDLPFRHYDYGKVMGACCENVVGYMPVPLGVAGPLLLDGKRVLIPMATTEGCLVASTNRGCRALDQTGVKSRIIADGMTRGPVVRFQSAIRATEAALWLKNDENFAQVKTKFDSTSRFAKLSHVSTHIAGRYLFIRVVAVTGDAMGMNMISKGTELALKVIGNSFPDMEILSLSGNICTDKKPSAINWIEGRGKSVVCEAVVSADVVATVLKSSTQALVDLNISKNMIGSAVAGSIGGFNAHAANIVTAIFIATGQDAAQNVSSSNCITIMEPWGDKGEDLMISCTMPSMEIGTIGGGTGLPAQSACLEMLGVKGSHAENPGDNAKQLARIICGAVLAGELSLMAALASGHLVRSHLRYNRSYSAGGSIVKEQVEKNETAPCHS